MCELENPPKSIEQILEYTDLKGLLKLSEINRNFSDYAAAAFKTYHANKTRIRIGLGELGNIDKYVYQPKVILKTLKLFGPGIKMMDFYCYGMIDDRYTRVINRLINNCSCSSLTDLAMYDCTGHVWEDLTQPFKKVQRFSYYVRSGDMGNDFKPFNELFPNVMFLTMPNFMARDGSHADCTLPKLIQLTLMRRYQIPEMGSSFEKVIRKNPQIKIFAAMNLTAPFLKFVGQTLPNIQALQLTLLAKGTDTIEFPNVEWFIGIQVAAENLKLPKLKKLQLRFNDLNRESCIKFIHNHPNIDQFTLMRGSELDNQIFADLISNLPNVTEMSINDGNRIWPQNIIDFMGNHVKLRKLDLGYCTKDANKLFREQLEDKWKIVNYKNCLSFSRKN